MLQFSDRSGIAGSVLLIVRVEGVVGLDQGKDLHAMDYMISIALTKDVKTKGRMRVRYSK